MEILSGEQSVTDLQRAFAEALDAETADQTPAEFRDQVRLNAHQKVFAERFAERAPTAWRDLVFLVPIAETWLAHHLRTSIGTGGPEDVTEAHRGRVLLSQAIEAWMEKYGIDAPWMRVMAYTTIRAIALTSVFKTVEPPKTLLHNTFPTVIVKGGMVELGQSSFEPKPSSTVVVCADLGLQEWDTLGGESVARFRQRLIDAFTEKLDAQLARVDHPILSKDLEVKQHWIDMTIDRYAGRLSVRATAQRHGVARPAVDKAVEATRQILGFKKLPDDWHATSPRAWRLHAT